jgi:hypothetical protein
MKNRLQPKLTSRGRAALRIAGLLLWAGLLSGALHAAVPPNPIVEMRWPEGTNGYGGPGVTTTNAGILEGLATFDQPDDATYENGSTNVYPAFTNTVPVGTYVPGGNSYALNLGPIVGSSGGGSFGRAVDLSTTYGPAHPFLTGMNTLGECTNLTICGWLNCNSETTGGGGNRIAFALEAPDGAGFDLVKRAQGELALGINQWADAAPGSSPGMVTVSSSLSPNNWVFFAVTWDYALSSGQLKYYFGRPDKLAALDVARDYTGNTVTTNPPGYLKYTGLLTIGNFGEVEPARDSKGGTSRIFRGLIDEITVYTNVLTLDEIQQAQVNATVPATPVTFIKQPVNVTAPAGAIATFSCEANGSGLVTYQWKTNGADVAGATGTTLTLSNVQLSESGTTVSVVADNAATTDPGLASATVTLTVIPAEPKIVSFSFSANQDILTPNMGAFAGTGRLKVSSGFPAIISTNLPSGPYAPTAAYNKDALHMGIGAAVHRAVDMTNNIVSAVGSLSSMNALTICGWLNSANDTFRTTSAGRGCGIVNASLGGVNGGFVLGYRSDNLGLPYGQNGRLQFHVNEFAPDIANNLSSTSTIPIGNTNCGPENWVFFAVTYDGASSANNLSFYFGHANQQATNDVTLTYNKGVINATGPLAVGNHNCTPGDPNTRMPGNPDGRNIQNINGAMWRGMIDEIKIYNKVLTLTEIREAQVSTPLPPYLMHGTETNNLILSWDGPFQLQDRASLDTGSWADNTTPTNVFGTIRSLALPISGGQNFFRLRD